MILKAQQGLSAHLQGTSNLWPLAQPRWKDSVRCSTEGGDGTNQERYRATDTIDTSLSTTFRNGGTAGWDELHGKPEAPCPALQKAGSDLAGARSCQLPGKWELVSWLC